jgi:hypothetical protein
MNVEIYQMIPSFVITTTEGIDNTVRNSLSKKLSKSKATCSTREKLQGN